MSRRIPALDGVRGIAILLVVISHVRGQVPLSHMATIIGLYVGNGDLGVQTFFVLSGYLITTLLIEEFEKRGTIDVRRFYLRRVGRIFPPFYVWLGVLSVLAALGYVRVTLPDFIGTALFVGDYFPGVLAQSWWTGNSWTLNIEQWFYVVYPAFVLYVGFRKSAIALVAVIALEPLLRIAEYHDRVDPIAIMMQTHSRFDTIAYGCLLALVLRREGVREWFASRWAAVVAAIAAAIVIVIVPTLDVKLVADYKFAFGFSIDAIGVAIVVGYLTQRPLGQPARALSCRPIVWLGSISYSLFLWQQPFFSKTAYLPLPFEIVGAFACASLSYYVIERPILASRRRRKRSRLVRELIEIPGSV